MSAKRKKSKSSEKAKKAPVENITPVVEETKPFNRVVAVIDIGTSSIRLNVAEIAESGRISHLEVLSQTVTLGQEVFVAGSITLETIARAVETLSQFKDVMASYGVTKSRDIRVVATSAVRDALNRQAFVDRVYIATGLEVNVIDQAEETRLTYMGIEKVLRASKWARKSQSLVVEIGGGSTEVLLLRGLDVLFSQSYRLGALRLRESVDAQNLSGPRMRQVLESTIERTIDRIVGDAGMTGTPALLALGSDARWAASVIDPEWDKSKVARVSIASLQALVDTVLSLNTDELVRDYHITYAEADNMGPTLLAYLMLARSCGCKQIRVTTATMRDGIMAEMSGQGAWSGEFEEQIVQSAINLGRKYDFDEAHGLRVARMCRKLFDGLTALHGLDRQYGLLLYVAALLHEIGLFISYQSHHKHSMYLIRNSELFGLGNREMQLVALIARYHRRAMPKMTHDIYGDLNRSSRLIVKKLAAILRVADAMERGHGLQASDRDFEIVEDQLVIYDHGISDISIEQMALAEKGDMFEELYGLTPVLRSLPRKEL